MAAGDHTEVYLREGRASTIGGNKAIRRLHFFILNIMCKYALAALAASLISAGSSSATLRLPAIFSDHMVLQAGQDSALWGWGDPGKSVRVSFFDTSGEQKVKNEVNVGNDGRWMLDLPSLPAGTAGTLKIQSEAEEKAIGDVLVGEVWLGSGQSNMEFPVKGRTGEAVSIIAESLEDAKNAAKIAKAKIRFFQVAKRGESTPQDNISGKWIVVTPDTVGDCSAIAWYFAQALHDELNVPVGVITAAWGGTPIEAWLSKETLDATSVGAEVWKRHNDLLAKFPPEKVKELRIAAAKWRAANPTLELKKQNKASKPTTPYLPENSDAPTRIFNGMINGLAPYTIQGFLWYQGEANYAHYQEYGELIRALIASWRVLWGKSLPFYYVELAGLGEEQTAPVESPPKWPYIREAQNEALQLPNTGVVTAVDLGMANNIHPPFKKPLGQRLASLALQNVYGRDVLARSPQFSGMSIKGSKVRITFDNADGLRSRNNSKLKGFAISGPDGRWKWAEASIEETDVLIWNVSVAEPKAVRYGWGGNPIISLENSAGLPLRPFRTDPAGRP